MFTPTEGAAEGLLVVLAEAGHREVAGEDAHDHGGHIHAHHGARRHRHSADVLLGKVSSSVDRRRHTVATVACEILHNEQDASYGSTQLSPGVSKNEETEHLLT